MPLQIRKFIDSLKNIFGLFRWYVGKLPNSDPEELVNLEVLTDTPSKQGPNHGDSNNVQTPSTENSFFHFPNESLLNLSNWYLSNGPQKLLNNLKNLMAEGFLETRSQQVQWCSTMA